MSETRFDGLFRVLVFAIFGGVIAAAAAFQLVSRRNVALQTTEIEPAHATARATIATLGQLQTDLQDLKAKAQLLVYLRHRWPTTRVLAAVARPVCDNVTLTHLRITRDSPDFGRNSATTRNEGGEGGNGLDQQPPAAPAVVDLAALREQDETRRTVALVTGTADDIASLHRYVARLDASDLFEKAELLGIEHLDTPDSPQSSQFNVRVIVRPGYGQPDSAPPAGDAVVRTEKPQTETLPES